MTMKRDLKSESGKYNQGLEAIKKFDDLVASIEKRYVMD